MGFVSSRGDRTAEHMAYMTKRRRELGRLGGRPKKPSREEAREAALERLVPKALSALEAQLDSEDERIAQVASIKLMEWGWGKPGGCPVRRGTS